jgi:hypothetical protein
MKVILGGNSFIDCQALLAYQGHPILRVLQDPLRVTLNTIDVQNVRHLVVDEDGHVEPSDVGHVLRWNNCFAFISSDSDSALLLAIESDRETIYLRLELRPLGMNIYDDVNGLHIGGNAFKENEIRNAATAINLG